MPLVSFHALEENDRRPAILVGTSSDRIGTPTGQSYYVTLSKDLKAWTGLPVAPYAGAVYGTYEDKLRAIGGANVTFGRGFTGLLMFDGVSLHELLTYSRGRHGLTLMLVRGRDFGFSYSLQF